MAEKTLVLPYNDPEAATDLFARMGKDIAGVVVEPWAGNMGLVPPAPGFLETLRDLTARHGSLLVFDEVITGFRVPEGGVQQRTGLTPDLTCLGKVVGGGMPVGALGGPGELMDRLAPLGPVYQAGTLSGNPVSMACGRATLEVLDRPGTYETLEARGRQLEEGLLEAARDAGLPLSVTRLGSVLGLFFSPSVPLTLEEVKATRGDLYPAFFHGMMDRGHAFAPQRLRSALRLLRPHGGPDRLHRRCGGGGLPDPEPLGPEERRRTP